MATEERILKTTLKFTVSDTEAQKASAAARKAAKDIDGVKKSAEGAEKATKKATESTSDLAKITEKAAASGLKFTEAMGKNAEKTLRIMRNYVDEAEKAEKHFADAKASLNEMRESSERLGSVSSAVAGMGAAITAPLLLASAVYVSKAGQAEDASRRWLVATDKIGKATTDIGRVTTQAVLPYLEKAAKLAEKAADFVEANPDVVSAALKVGTAVTVLGSIGLAVSKGIRLYADIKTLALGTE